MTTRLAPSRLQKRLDIWASKLANPKVSARQLAKIHGVTYRLVEDALSRPVDAWKRDLSTVKAGCIPSSSTPTNPPEPMKPREYQASAAAASITRNTLLVLPTGLGKTVVALLHVRAILSAAPAGVTGICIMMAPTKALLVQHKDLFQRHLAIPEAALAIVDGETTPDNRRLFYKGLAGRPVVLFMTPLTVLNDLEKGRLPRAAIIDLVVDEAHHATKGDPYALVSACLREHEVHPRVLAMTASPGETEARIVEVCQNLGIRPSDMIIKNRDDPDVEAYVFHLDVKRYEMDLTPEYEDVRGRLVALLREPCAWLQSAGLVGAAKKAGSAAGGTGSMALPSWDKLRVLANRQLAGASARSIRKGEAEPEAEPDLDPRLVTDEPAIAWGGARPDLVSNLVLALRARHCVELVETQGFPALLAYHEKLAAKVAEEPTESLLALVTHPQYKVAMDVAGKLVRDGSPRARHPKLDVLADVARDFVASHPSSRCIVFTKYRASIPMLVAHLSGVASVVARRFVGQGDSGRNDKGMSRDEQQAVLRAFKAGEFNVLVATKAAEEGIDVADCDMVAFYEATASVIQFIQRQGRAGRRRDGDIAIMHAKGTSDQLNAALLDTKLRDMGDILYKVQHVRAVGMPEPRPAAITRIPSAPIIPSPEVPPSSSHHDLRVEEKSLSSPIKVNPACLVAGELVAGLAAAGIVVRLDGSIPGDVAAPGGIGVRVITASDAEYWDAEVTGEELPGVARPVIAVLRAPALVVGQLRQRLGLDGIAVWSITTGAEIAGFTVKARQTDSRKKVPMIPSGGSCSIR